MPAVNRFTHEAMNTGFQLVLHGLDPTLLREAATDAFHELDRLEGLLSRFDPGSEIGMINSLTPGESRHTDPDVMECLLTALWVHRETAGAFDICIAAEMDHWRDANGHVTKPRGEDESRMPRQASMDTLVLDPEERTVGRADSGAGIRGQGLCIDLGGIGKGFAIDRLGSLLEARGCGDFLVHSSSSILAVGSNPEGGEPGWRVGVGGEWGEAAGVDSVVLCGGALSCSGVDVKGTHILNPSTGVPASGHEAAWALSPSAAVADALSTAFMVMKTAEVEAFCMEHDGIEGYVVAEGRLLHFK